MKQVEKDINNALDLINCQRRTGLLYNESCSSFIFGNENQEGINSVLGYKGKDVLTVASSGDQYLGAVYYGAKGVDLFDINRNSEYITYLKIASILVLDFEEFKRFFFPTNEQGNINMDFWNLRTFKKIMMYLPDDIARFWDVVLYNTQKLCFGNFVAPFSIENEMQNVLKGMPFYSSETEYNKLRIMLSGRKLPSFKQGDILKLGKRLYGKYDIVYLSNILECIVYLEMKRQFFPSPTMENYMEFHTCSALINSVADLVSEDGTVLLSYRGNSSTRDSIDWLYDSIFDVNEIPCKIDVSYLDGGAVDTDLVLTYTPKKGKFLG